MQTKTKVIQRKKKKGKKKSKKNLMAYIARAKLKAHEDMNIVIKAKFESFPKNKGEGPGPEAHKANQDNASTAQTTPWLFNN